MGVWGASSTVGQFAVQLATQAGYKVIGTASAKNHEFIRSLGAVGVVDYHDEDAVEQIKAIGLPVAAFDCASAETALKCALAINPTTGGSVVTIAGAPSEGVPENVKVLGLVRRTRVMRSRTHMHTRYTHDGCLASAGLATLPVPRCLRACVPAGGCSRRRLVQCRSVRVAAQVRGQRVQPAVGGRQGEDAEDCGGGGLHWCTGRPEDGRGAQGVRRQGGRQVGVEPACGPPTSCRGGGRNGRGVVYPIAVLATAWQANTLTAVEHQRCVRQCVVLEM